MRVELLAPAKDKETAICAINYGADAVYIGANAFGARHNATNPLNDIKEVIDYAHKFYAKVFITINTILDNKEILEAQKLIWNLYELKADAIIFQDMGLLELDLPPIAMHASTQCNNRSLDKVKFLSDSGINRVILARELSLNQIKNICENTDTEIEVFIHGALCVSYSGQCYLSHNIGGRSANRGECAQPCRKKYSIKDKNGNYLVKNKYVLNLKDFNASEHIQELIEIGVTSFKIEGRLKDTNYVKNVVGYYRKLIDKYARKTSSGTVNFDFEPDLNKTFNRGYTDYFLKKRQKISNFSSPKFIGEKMGKITKVGKNYFEYSGKKLSNQDGLCFFNNDEQEGFLVNRTEGNKIYPNRMLNFKENAILYRNIDVTFNKMLENSKTTRKIGVEFFVKNDILIAKDEDNNVTQVTLENFEEAKNIDKAKQTIIDQLNKTGETDFYVQNITLKLDKIPFIPVSKLNAMRREILNNLMETRLKNYKPPKGINLKQINYFEKEVNYNANIHNDFAKQFYEKRNCKVCEYSFETQKPHNATLMRTKHCIKFALDICKSEKELFLEDEFGVVYPLEFDCKNCEMLIKSPISKN